MKKIRNSQVKIRKINALEAKIKFYKYTALRNFETRHKWDLKVIPLEHKVEKLKNYFKTLILSKGQIYIKRVDITEIYSEVYFSSIEYVAPKSVIVCVTVKTYGQIVEFVNVELENIYYNEN